MRPTAWIAVAVAGGLVVAAGVAWFDRYGDGRAAAGYKAGQAEVQGRWTAAENRRLQVANLAEQAEREKERLRRVAQQKADDEKTQREAALLVAVDRSRAAEQRVQQRLAAIVRASTGGGSFGGDLAAAGGRSPVEAVANVLGRCIGEYRSLAERATRDHSAGQLCEQRYDALTEVDPGGHPELSSPR